MAQPPNFYLFLTDGDPNHLPSDSEKAKDYKTTDDYGLTQKALSNFATEIMRIQNMKIEKGQMYSKIPFGYSVWPCQRGGHQDVPKPKIDWYIFGHPSHKKFDSFAQFAIHINFLQTQPPQGNCTCKVCVKHPFTSQSAVPQDPAPARIVRPADSAEQEADFDSDATISAADDISDCPEDGGDSDATISAEEDISDNTDDRARKPEKGNKPTKRALSSKTASKKPSKRARVQGNNGGNDGRTDADQEEEGLGVGGAEVENSED